MIDAIAAGNTACVACHPGDGHTALHDTTAPASCQGSGCHHQTNLIPIHTAIGCAGCHESTNQDVIDAIAAGDKDCVACHPGGRRPPALHDTTVPASCQGSGCHNQTNLIPIHTAIGCAGCHESTNQDVIDAIAAGDKDCVACHPGGGDHSALHETTVPASCQGSGCHNQTNLIPIHTAIGCAGCHESTDPNVVNAISTGNKDCGACHPGGGNHAALHDGGFSPDEDCGLCHNQNLVVQHDGYCDYCHESTNPVVIDAIASGNTECGACHSTLHGATLTYFDFQEGNGVTTGAAFKKVFPPASFNTTYAIDNGSWALGTATPHSGYSQSTAKCGVCHAVHRAPTAGTSANATIDNGGSATTSSRYKGSAWTAQASTQMLLKSTTSGACLYCHVAEAPTKMFGGDMTLALAGETAFGWNEFYGHTTGCVSCHAVHGARTFKSADKTVDAKILKYKGVKNLGTIALKIQPEVYAGGGALYNSLAEAQSRYAVSRRSGRRSHAPPGCRHRPVHHLPRQLRCRRGRGQRQLPQRRAVPARVMEVGQRHDDPDLRRQRCQPRLRTSGHRGHHLRRRYPERHERCGRFAHHEVQEPPDEGRRPGIPRRRCQC